MAKFYAFHFTEGCRMPALSPEQAAGLKQAIGEAMGKMPGVIFNGVMWNPDTAIAVADIDAPDLQTAQAFCKTINSPPFDTIVPVEPLAL